MFSLKSIVKILCWLNSGYNSNLRSSVAMWCACLLNFLEVSNAYVFSKRVKEDGGGVKNPENSVNVVYECPIEQ